MRRTRIPFNEFEQNFINKPDGYFPVYSCLDEDDDSKPLKIMLIDMICEWRLEDAKVSFIEVPFETQEEFDMIVEYLKSAATILHGIILRRIDKLVYPSSV